VAGKINSMKYSNDPIGNRARDLPACNAVPQSTASSPIPIPDHYSLKNDGFNNFNVSWDAASMCVDRLRWSF
jgi:hypothetical protein